MAKTIITLGREYCTGGRYIAKDVARALGIKLYDKELITMAAKNSGLSEEAVAASEKRHTHSLLYSLYTMGNDLPLGHAGKGWAEPCTTADHLPKLRFAAYFFEEHQIRTLRHINARIHHIHRDRNKRRLVLLLEVVNDGLCIGIVADHPLDESRVLGLQLRVEQIGRASCRERV